VPTVVNGDDTHLLIGIALKWFVSQTPYLVHQNTIAPHITGSGVLPIQQSLQVSWKVQYFQLSTTSWEGLVSFHLLSSCLLKINLRHFTYLLKTAQ